MSRAIITIANYATDPWQITRDEFVDLTGVDPIPDGWHEIPSDGLMQLVRMKDLEITMEAVVSGYEITDPDYDVSHYFTNGRATVDERLISTILFPFLYFLEFLDPPTNAVTYEWMNPGGELGRDGSQYYLKAQLLLISVYKARDVADPLYDQAVYYTGYTLSETTAIAKSEDQLISTEPCTGGSYSIVGSYKTNLASEVIDFPIYGFTGPTALGGDRVCPGEFSVMIEAASSAGYYPYDDGGGPIWDADTGEQLIAPMPMSM